MYGLRKTNKTRYRTIWIDKECTRFIAVPFRKHRKLEEEFANFMTTVKLLGYKYSVVGDRNERDDGRNYILNVIVKNESREYGLHLTFLMYPNSNILCRINVHKRENFENENIYSSMSWLESIRKARKYL